MTRRFTWRSVAIVGFALAMTGTVWANGDDFFEPAATDQPVDLVYVGHVRDKATGKLIRGAAFITVDDTYSGISFPFTNDKPGHFRSPDVGLALTSAGQEKRDELTMRAVVAGYKNTTITKLPRKSKGVVDVTFYMERDGTPLATEEEDYYGTARLAANNPDATPPWAALLGGLATIIVLAGGRTLSLRRSTTR
jgi:hypothetical protein